MALRSIENVYSIFKNASNVIKDAANGDSRTSRKDMDAKLATLTGDFKTLVELYFRFIDHRDAAPGASVTAVDLEKALAYARTHMIEKYDLEPLGNEDAMISTDEAAQGSRSLQLAHKIAASDADGGMTDPELETYIVDNFPPGDEPSADVSRKIGVGELGDELPDGLPEELHEGLQGAIDEIDDRSFDGSDYNAWVTGIYEVVSDGEVVGYVVQGAGTGEPDYSDAMTYGFNLDGLQVAFEEADW
jgi:hypothetical protein